MRAWTAALLLACAIGPFLPARHWPPVHDDVSLRGPGSLVADPRAGAGLLLRADLFGSFERPTGVSGYWRPAVLLGWRAEHWLTDGAERPFSWLGHLVNLALHGLATLALWRVLAALGLAPAASTLAAALFAVHPVHPESVVWLSTRGDVGSTAFAWWGTALLLESRGGRGARDAPAARAAGRRTLAAAALLAALLFKESAVLLVGIAALLPRLAGARWRDGLLPAGGALLAYAALRAALFEHGVDESAWMGPERADVRWWTWLSILPELVRLCVWPGPAVPVRRVPLAEAWDAPGVPAGAVLVAALAVIGWLCWRRRLAVPAFATLLLLGSLLLLAPWARFPTGFEEAAAPLYDRYLYVAAAAPGLALAAWAAPWLAAAPRLAFVATALLALPLGLLAAERSRAWSSDEAFARAGLAADPRSAGLHNTLGVALLERARADGRRETVEEALAGFDRALALRPGWRLAELNRFHALVLLDRQDDAEVAAHALLARAADDPRVLEAIARWRMSRAHWAEAAGLLERAVATGVAPPSTDEAVELLRRVEQRLLEGRLPDGRAPNDGAPNGGAPDDGAREAAGEGAGGPR